MENNATEIITIAKTVITWMDYITIVVSFITLFFVIKNWLIEKKQLDKISIYFNDKKLNLDITRKDITRAELQGILGILRKDMTKNYDIKYLATIDYLDSIYKVQKDKVNKLKIEIKETELKQFRDDIYQI